MLCSESWTDQQVEDFAVKALVKAGKSAEKCLEIARRTASEYWAAGQALSMLQKRWIEVPGKYKQWVSANGISPKTAQRCVKIFIDHPDGENLDGVSITAALGIQSAKKSKGDPVPVPPSEGILPLTKIDATINQMDDRIGRSSHTIKETRREMATLSATPLARLLKVVVELRELAAAGWDDMNGTTAAEAILEAFGLLDGIQDKVGVEV